MYIEKFYINLNYISQELMGSICCTENNWLVLNILSKPVVADIIEINAIGVHLASSCIQFRK